MKQLVAISGVCAWPKLTLQSRPHAALVVVFNQPTPGLWAGELACWETLDSGDSWQHVGYLSPNVGGATYVNAAIGSLSSGRLLGIYAGFGQRPPPENPEPIDEATTLPTVFTSSEDHGVSWASPQLLPPPYPGCHEFTPSGKIVEIGPDCAATILYGYDTPTTSQAHMYQIKSGGTWEVVGMVNPEGPSIDETELVWLGGGDLLAFGRTYPEARIGAFASTNGGKTWHYRGYVTNPGESPASACLSTDGKLVLTYGFRRANQRGIAVRWSEDRGDSWSDDYILAEYNPNSHGGHPSTVCLGDATLLTAYFAERSKACSEYHMATVRWTPASLLASRSSSRRG